MLAVIEHLEAMSNGYQREALQRAADGNHDGARIAELGALNFSTAAKRLRALYGYIPQEKETA